MEWLAWGVWVGGLAVGLSALRRRYPTTINIVSEYDDVDSVKSVIVTAHIAISASKRRPSQAATLNELARNNG